MDDTMLSPVAQSNLFTMGCASKNDPRQAIPAPYTMPDEATRRTRIRLELEEVIEHANAFGFSVHAVRKANPKKKTKEVVIDIAGADDFELTPNLEPDLYEAIDACIDLGYVADGSLCAMGVPDMPHKHEVCRANDAKFPNGEAVTDAHGKFQKPPGWSPPDHAAVRKRIPEVDLRVFSQHLMDGSKPKAVSPGQSLRDACELVRTLMAACNLRDNGQTLASIEQMTATLPEHLR